jgi:hypothetical protein
MPENVSSQDGFALRVPTARPSYPGIARIGSLTAAQQRFVKGKSHASKSYSSGTPNPTTAMETNSKFGLDVSLVLHASTASDLRHEATMPAQSEVILARDTRLTVSHVETKSEDSGFSRGRPERRFAVLAHTPNSSPVRLSEVDQEWLKWARLSKADARKLRQDQVPDVDEGFDIEGGSDDE